MGRSFQRPLPWLVIMATLGACSNSEEHDLESYMAEIESRSQHPRLEPAPTLSLVPISSYHGAIGDLFRDSNAP
jgi:Tfp pilus assembly protein PilP